MKHSRYLLLDKGAYIAHIGFFSKRLTDDYLEAKRFTRGQATRLEERYGFQKISELELESVIKVESLEKQKAEDAKVCLFMGKQIQLNTHLDIYFYLQDDGQLSTMIYLIEAPDGSGNYYTISPSSDLYQTAQGALNKAKLSKREVSNA